MRKVLSYFALAFFLLFIVSCTSNKVDVRITTKDDIEIANGDSEFFNRTENLENFIVKVDGSITDVSITVDSSSVNFDVAGNYSIIVSVTVKSKDYEQVFEVTVLAKEKTDAQYVYEAKSALNISTTVSANFTLPVSATGNVAISWSSNNTAIAISGSNATVVRANNDVAVTLTATITKGTATDTKTFSVVVLGLSNPQEDYRQLTTAEKALFTTALAKDYTNMTIFDPLYEAEYYFVDNHIYVVDVETNEVGYYGYTEGGKYYLNDEDGLQEIDVDEFEYWFPVFNFDLIDVNKLVTDGEYVYLFDDAVDFDYFIYYYSSELDLNYFTFELSTTGYIEFIGICDNYEGEEDLNFLEIYDFNTTVAPGGDGPITGDLRDLTSEEKTLFLAAIIKNYSNMTIYDAIYGAEYYYVDNYIYVVDAEYGDLIYYGYTEGGKYYYYDEEGLQEIDLDEFEYWFLVFNFNEIDVDKLKTDGEFVYLFIEDVDIEYFAYYYSDLDLSYFTFEISTTGYFEYIGICDNYEGAEDFNYLEIYDINTTVAPDGEEPGGDGPVVGDLRDLTTEEKTLFLSAIAKNYSNMTIYDPVFGAEYYFVDDYIYVIDVWSGELYYYGYIENGKYYYYDEEGLVEIDVDEYEYYFPIFNFDLIDVDNLQTDGEYIYLFAEDIDFDYFIYYYSSELDLNYFTFEISVDGYFEFIGICDNYEGFDDLNFLEIYDINATVAPGEEEPGGDGPVVGDLRDLTSEEKTLFLAAIIKNYSNMTIYDAIYGAEYYYVDNYIYVVDAEYGDLIYYGYTEGGKYYYYDEEGLAEIDLDEFEYWFPVFNFDEIDVDKLKTDGEFVYLFIEDVDIEYFAYYYSDLDLNYFTFEISTSGYFEYIGICDNYEGAEDFNYLEIYDINTTVAPDGELPEPLEYDEISAVLNGTTGNTYTVKGIVVEFIYSVGSSLGRLGFYIADDTGIIYVYGNSEIYDIEIGDLIVVTAKRAIYTTNSRSFVQLSNYKIDEIIDYNQTPNYDGHVVKTTVDDLFTSGLSGDSANIVYEFDVIITFVDSGSYSTFKIVSPTNSSNVFNIYVSGSPLADYLQNLYPDLAANINQQVTVLFVINSANATTFRGVVLDIIE